MEVSQRNRLIDTYYDGLDKESPPEIVSAFAADVTYRYPGAGDITGRDAVEEFFAEGRPTSETTHEVTRRIHDDTATACEGRVTGKREGEDYKSEFAGVFTFDEDAGKIAEVAVYSRR